MKSIIYLKKDNPDLICHCKCPTALVTFPVQLGCPWCGCGWTFSCIECRRAFTFAVGVEVSESWEELARRDLVGFGIIKPSREAIKERAEAMKELLADVEIGGKYVYFDGAIIPVDATGIEFEGLHSQHDLKFVPQVKALFDRSIFDDVLTNVAYWEENAVSDE
jgi:hypothetical protein